MGERFVFPVKKKMKRATNRLLGRTPPRELECPKNFTLRRTKNRTLQRAYARCGHCSVYEAQWARSSLTSPFAVASRSSRDLPCGLLERRVSPVFCESRRTPRQLEIRTR